MTAVRQAGFVSGPDIIINARGEWYESGWDDGWAAGCNQESNAPVAQVASTRETQAEYDVGFRAGYDDGVQQALAMTWGIG